MITYYLVCTFQSQITSSIQVSIFISADSVSSIYLVCTLVFLVGFRMLFPLHTRTHMVSRSTLNLDPSLNNTWLQRRRVQSLRSAAQLLRTTKCSGKRNNHHYLTKLSKMTLSRWNLIQTVYLKPSVSFARRNWLYSWVAFCVPFRRSFNIKYW